MSIFAEIIARRAPGEILWESNRAVAIRDIHPIAPVHLLLIPKITYPNLQAIPAGELEIVSHIASAAQHLAEQFGVAEGYRLLTNTGPGAGQSVNHLHFHLIGGRQLGAMG